MNVSEPMQADRAAAPPAWRALAARYYPALVLGAAFTAMLLVAGPWPDPFLDFGHELYSAWRLREGQVLARDVALSAGGTFSPYFNAALFATFGVGLQTLVVANLLLLLADVGLLWIALRVVAGRGWATAACVFFLAVFAFGQYLQFGSFNYVTPYSHGATHGLLLALAAIVLRWRFARSGALPDLVAASTCLGLVSLTKPEILVASVGAAALDLALALRSAAGARARIRLAAAATLPALVPPALSIALVGAVAGRAVGWQATFAPWIMATTPVTRNPFYAAVLGLDDPAGNLLRAAGWFAAVAAPLAAVALLDVRAGTGRTARLAAAVAALVVAAVLWRWGGPEVPFDLARALPLAWAAGAIVLLATRRGEGTDPATRLHAGLALFAGLLLVKMGLHARIHHYGFVLAMPATMLVIVWLGSSVPRFLRARGGSGLVLQSVLATGLALFAIVCVRITAMLVASKAIPVGTGADTFLADGRGRYVNALTEWIAKHGDPGATLAVFPEGVMINYLLRREIPSPYLTFLPDAIAWKGESALRAPLVARPPTYVAIVSRDSSEHGARTFGRDYAVETFRWIRERYEQVAAFGGSPLDPRDRYGALLFRLREAGAPSSAPPR